MEIEKIAGGNSNYSAKEVATQSAVATSTSSEIQKFNRQDKRVEKSEESDKQEGYNEKKKRAASEATIEDAVKSANRKMDKTRCEYSYHEKTHRVSIKVIDSETDKVIREIPPKESLDMLQKMWEMAGILVDERR
ncbi:flagellar protein FlaG [Eubacterium xylanophilum]|uniref:flagellar protein FlaG n=1 Tax=Eubacterium xylanophilum TaxID=39497 RepID=UPI0004B62D35|nr:flagellar protein FlaG [Eubacterium xylanophilum]